jgi:hypothetical protein
MMAAGAAMSVEEAKASPDGTGSEAVDRAAKSGSQASAPAWTTAPTYAVAATTSIVIGMRERSMNPIVHLHFWR